MDITQCKTCRQLPAFCKCGVGDKYGDYEFKPTTFNFPPSSLEHLQQRIKELEAEVERLKETYNQLHRWYVKSKNKLQQAEEALRHYEKGTYPSVAQDYFKDK